MFDEVASVISSRDPGLIDSRFSRIASITGTTDVIRYRTLNGTELLSELSQCVYSGGGNFDGLVRMLWTCEGRAPTSSCYSPNILMGVMAWSQTEISLSLEDERISKDQSCLPAPPQRSGTSSEGGH